MPENIDACETSGRRRSITAFNGWMTAAVLAAACVTVANTASAQQDGNPPVEARAAHDTTTDPRAVQPERPTVATHAYTVAPGYLEIEAGAQEGQPHNASQFVAPIVVKVGLDPRLQLELQGGYVRNAAYGYVASGMSDVAVALKQRIRDDVPLLGDFSLQGALKLATGSRDVGTRTTDVSILAITSKRMGSSELDLNASYTRRSGNGSITPRAATLLAASFGYPIRGAIGGVAELFSYPHTNGPAGTPAQMGFLFGPTLQVHPWLVLDAGAIMNVRAMGANALYAGLTYNAGRLP